MYETRYRRQNLELRRQQAVREGWWVLREVAGTMKKKATETLDAFLDDVEGRLKRLLAERSTRNHKALGLFQSTASWMRKTGNLDYGMGLLRRSGPSF